MPEILDGFRNRFCSFAILMVTGTNLRRNRRQQHTMPQLPTAPSICVSCRTPIWRSSMRVWYSRTRSFTSSRKSIRVGAVK